MKFSGVSAASRWGWCQSTEEATNGLVTDDGLCDPVQEEGVIMSVHADSGIRADVIAAKLSSVEGIDLATMITDLILQQTAYQAALGATANVVPPSLSDFLR